jgi:hypothetical protein
VACFIYPVRSAIASAAFIVIQSLVCSGFAHAQTKPSAASSPVPAAAENPNSLIEKDIFGFTGTSDTGNKGDIALGLENDGRISKRDGRYFAFSSKAFAGYTFADNWWVGVAAFGTLHNIRNVTAQPFNLNRGQIDGGSVEIMHRLISRSASNPFAVALAFESRWGRFDGGSGLRATSSSNEFKLHVDAVVIPGRLFWAGNLNWSPTRQQDPLARNVWLRSSGTNISTALAAAVTESATIGAELRYQTQFNSLLPRRYAGHAVFLGPTAMIKVNEVISINGTFAMQIAGSAKATPGQHLDLDNFERRIFRVSLQAGF